MSSVVQTLLQSDPALRKLRTDLPGLAKKTVELVLDKALTHLGDPAGHPLPPGHCAERAFVDWLNTLPAHRRKKVADRATERLDAQKRPGYYGALHMVDLRQAAPIAEQVKPLLVEALGLTAADQTRINGFLKSNLKAKARARVAALPRLSCKLFEAECVEKTLEIFEGADEIKLKVTMFNQEDLITGVPSSVQTVDLGKFSRRKRTKTFSQELGQIRFAPGRPLPQGCVALFEITETDLLRPDDVENRLLFYCLALMAGLLIALLLFILAPEFAIVAWEMFAYSFFFGGEILLSLASVFVVTDDVFMPTPVTLTVITATDQFNRQPVVTRLLGNNDAGRGEYKLTVQFSLV